MYLNNSSASFLIRCASFEISTIVCDGCSVKVKPQALPYPCPRQPQQQQKRNERKVKFEQKE